MVSISGAAALLGDWNWVGVGSLGWRGVEGWWDRGGVFARGRG